MTRSTVRSAATSRFRSSRDACWHSDSATLTEKKTFPSTRERPKQRRTLSKISLAAISPRPRPTVTTKCRVWSGIEGGGACKWLFALRARVRTGVCSVAQALVPGAAGRAASTCVGLLNRSLSRSLLRWSRGGRAASTYC
jgi:hypothetical protein